MSHLIRAHHGLIHCRTTFTPGFVEIRWESLFRPSRAKHRRKTSSRVPFAATSPTLPNRRSQPNLPRTTTPVNQRRSQHRTKERPRKRETPTKTRINGESGRNGWYHLTDSTSFSKLLAKNPSCVGVPRSPASLSSSPLSPGGTSATGLSPGRSRTRKRGSPASSNWPTCRSRFAVRTPTGLKPEDLSASIAHTLSDTLSLSLSLTLSLSHTLSLTLHLDLSSGFRGTSKKSIRLNNTARASNEEIRSDGLSDFSYTNSQLPRCSSRRNH